MRNLVNKILLLYYLNSISLFIKVMLFKAGTYHNYTFDFNGYSLKTRYNFYKSIAKQMYYRS